MTRSLTPVTDEIDNQLPNYNYARRKNETPAECSGSSGRGRSLGGIIKGEGPWALKDGTKAPEGSGGATQLLKVQFGLRKYTFAAFRSLRSGFLSVQ